MSAKLIKIIGLAFAIGGGHCPSGHAAVTILPL